MSFWQFVATPLGYLAVTASLFVPVLIWQTLQPAYVPLLSQRQRWPANGVLLALNLAIGSALGQILALMFLRMGYPYGTAWLPLTFWPPLVILAISILALDLWQYFFHRLMHRFDFLWRSHRVHHSDADFDLTTGFRFHPFEGILNLLWRLALVKALGITWVSLAVYAVLIVAVDFFTHANVSLNPKLDRALRVLLVTPDMHRIHHSIDAHDANSNYGTVFSLWDRLFGSYRAHATRGRLKIRVGIEPLAGHPPTTVASVLTMPFANEAKLRSRG